MRYIIDTTKPVLKSVENSMDEILDLVHYTGTPVTKKYIDERGCHISETRFENPLTFAQYNEQHGGKLKIVTEDELDLMFKEEEVKASFNWHEITEEKYYDLLECVPPKKMSSNYFIGGEPLFSNIYRVCAKVNSKYFSCIAPSTSTQEQIIASINEALNNENVLML